MSTPTYVRHRVNAPEDLAGVRPDWGVEIDLRSDVADPGAIHLSHDAWRRGPPFDAWLREYAARGIRGPLILNTKEDGLEERASEMVAAAGVDHYFFLDTTVPTLVRLSRAGWGDRLCVRVSSVEPPEAALRFAAPPYRVRWAWIDCFGGVPMPAQSIAALKPSFELCLVSPELQGLPIEEIDAFRGLYRLADAICTKKPSEWMARAPT